MEARNKLEIKLSVHGGHAAEVTGHNTREEKPTERERSYPLWLK